MQTDKGEDAVSFTITDTCTMPVDCSVSWRVVCAPESKKRRSVHAGSAKLNLEQSSSGATDASASSCGDDGWAIDSMSGAASPIKSDFDGFAPATRGRNARATVDYDRATGSCVCTSQASDIEQTQPSPAPGASARPAWTRSFVAGLVQP